MIGATRRRRACVWHHRMGAVFAVCGLLVGCASHRPLDGPTAELGRLRVATDAATGLRHCRYSSGQFGVSVKIGERAIEQIQDALNEVFRTDDWDEDVTPDLVAIPRVASVNASQEQGLGRVQATITYAAWFETPDGEPVVEVTGTGSGSSEYPGLINLARMLIHLGTLFLFEKIDVGRQYRQAMGAAQDDAAGALVAALQRSRELREYAATVRSARPTQTRDAALEELLDRVIDRRAMAIAVLDLQPLTGEATAVDSYLAEELRTRLAQRPGVRTFERALLRQALEELQLGMSDLVDPESARRFGRLVAADAILTGTTMQFSQDVKLTLRALKTETGEVIGAGSTTIRLGQGMPGGGAARRGPGPACP